MDSGAELQKLLDAIKRNPNLDEDRLHTILHKLKTLKETFDKLGDSELPGDQIAKLIDAETSTGKSLTWQPTFYEYIVFFIVLAFIILIFGKSRQIPIGDCY